MPRKHFKATDQFPYHVSARCINKEWFRLPMEDVWSIFSNYLFFIHYAFQIRIHSFVLMDNHFHLLISTPNANLNQAMNYFMRETSRVISRRSGRINQIYGAPYHWSILETPAYYAHAYKYVYRNPVEAGIVNSVEQYPYSTLHGLLGRRSLLIPLCYDDCLFTDIDSQLSWMNRCYADSTEKDSIRKALRKRRFEFGADKDRNRSGD